MSDTPEAATPRRRMLWIGGGVALLIVVVILAFSGHKGKPVVPGGTGAGGAVDSAPALLQRQLLSTLDGLRPERLSVSSNLDDQVNDLNFWWAELKPAAADPSAAAEEEQVRKTLGDDAAATAAAPQFDARDALHIRNAFLFRAVARHIADADERDLDRCVSAFNLTTRHVALRVGAEFREPLTPFEVLMLGRGTPADRAWVFIEILRQLRIDCVILEPVGSGDEDRSGDFLVGAILPENGVYLFDPQVGLPVPAADDAPGESVLVSRPATLAAVRADGGLLRQWDVPDGTAYPLTAERLQHVKVRAVTNATFSAGRMATLQAELPVDYAALLFDGLAPSPAREVGLLDRVREAGAGGLWSAEDVQIWSYPEIQTAGFYANGGEDAPALRERMDILHGPRILRQRIVGEGEMVSVIGESQQPLRYVRVQHLRGDLSDALISYGAIRSSNVGELREAINEACADDAAWWIPVCQYEMGVYEAALANTQLYRTTKPGGVWLDSIPGLEAECLAAEGRYSAAVRTLTEASAGGTLSTRDSFLIRRWQSRPDAAPPMD